MNQIANYAALTIIVAAAMTCTGSGCRADYSREDFDKADAAFNDGNGFKNELGDKLAWGESYVMLSYVEMYRATRDTHYLDKLVDHADHVLANRDDNRGFRDYSGRSRPAWSVDGKFTVAELVLNDADGKPAFKLRSTPYAYNNETKIRVVQHPDTRRILSLSKDDTFDLLIENAQWKKSEEYKGLSMDRDSPDFVERRVNARNWVAKERKIEFSETGSGLVTVEALGTRPPCKDSAGEPLKDRAVPMEPLSMAYHGYSGMIVFPMLELAWLVKSDPSLAPKYGKVAQRYVTEAVKVFRDAEEEWRDGPRKHEGYYVFGSYGCPFWSDNVGKPFNYLGSEAQCLLRLWQLTGDTHWRSRASAIAQLFKRHLRLADTAGILSHVEGLSLSKDGLRSSKNQAYVWDYWSGPIADGWTRDNSPSYNTPTYRGNKHIEDTSHGCLEVYFAALCADAGLVFTDDDMRRFAKTFTDNIVGLDASVRLRRTTESSLTMNDRVDGKGPSGSHDTMVGYWMELGRWDSRAASAAVKIAEQLELSGEASGSSMLTLARAIKWTSGWSPASGL